MLKTKVLIRSFSFYTFFCCCWLNGFRWGTNGHIRFLKILLPILLHLLFIVVVIADIAASSAPVSSASASSSSSPSSTWWFDRSWTWNCSAEVVWLAENRLDVFKILASFLWVCGHISVCLLCPVNHSIVEKKNRMKNGQVHFLPRLYLAMQKMLRENKRPICLRLWLVKLDRRCFDWPAFNCVKSPVAHYLLL